jgi:CHAT domain-containing protein/tetratricopeptide (TPR) repeat protein
VILIRAVAFFLVYLYVAGFIAYPAARFSPTRYLGSAKCAPPLTGTYSKELVLKSVGQSHKARLSKGQIHSYLVPLSSKEFVRLTVEQWGVDVSIRVLDPAGEPVIEKIDTIFGSFGPELVYFIAGTGGDYKVEITTGTEEDGWYRISLDERKAIASAAQRSLSEKMGRIYSLLALATGAIDDRKPREALEATQQAYQLALSGFGIDHINSLGPATMLASVLQLTGQSARAVEIYRGAIRLFEKKYGPSSSVLIEPLDAIAVSLIDSGNYELASAVLKRALKIHNKKTPHNQTGLVSLLNSLGGVYLSTEELPQAIHHFSQAVQIAEDHKEEVGSELFAQCLNNLGLAYYETGDYKAAEPYLKRAYDIRFQVLGDNDVSTAETLHNLGSLYGAMQQDKEAEEKLRKCLEIRDSLLDKYDPRTAFTASNLGFLYFQQKRYQEAAPLFDRALEIRLARLGPDHPATAESRITVGNILEVQGKYAEAAKEYELAQAALNKAHMISTDQMGKCLDSIAILRERMGDSVGALETRRRLDNIEEANIGLNLSAEGEGHKLAYLARIARYKDHAISLHMDSARNNLEAAKLAFNTILHHKGRVLDTILDLIGALRRHASTKQRRVLDSISSINGNIARLATTAPDQSRPSELQRLEEQRLQLERSLDATGFPLRLNSTRVSFDEVLRSLPKGSALIEFSMYRPCSPRREPLYEEFAAAHYVAYLLKESGEMEWFDLGPAADIDHRIDDLNQILSHVDDAALSDRWTTEARVKAVARELWTSVFEPLSLSLQDVSTVFLAPDGKINLLPFTALVDSSYEYLVKRFSFNYLSCGRDLLRFKHILPSRSSPVVIVDPGFSQTSGDTSGPAARAALMQAKSISGMLRRARLLQSPTNIRANIRRLSGPSILHIVAHGCYNCITPPVDDPALRSALVFREKAGTSASKREVLTALEIAGLDLWGTKLVVVASCESGLGELRDGEGVFGLRRALMLAGSESQVIALWNIRSDATAAIVLAYYRALAAGAGRGEALRLAQEQLLDSGRFWHPYFWAAFIESGMWTPIPPGQFLGGRRRESLHKEGKHE